MIMTGLKEYNMNTTEKKTRITVKNTRKKNNIQKLKMMKMKIKMKIYMLKKISMKMKYNLWRKTFKIMITIQSTSNKMR